MRGKGISNIRKTVRSMGSHSLKASEKRRHGHSSASQKNASVKTKPAIRLMDSIREEVATYKTQLAQTKYRRRGQAVIQTNASSAAAGSSRGPINLGNILRKYIAKRTGTSPQRTRSS